VSFIESLWGTEGMDEPARSLGRRQQSSRWVDNGC